MQNPTELTTLREFPEWKEKCNVKVFHSHPQHSMVFIYLLCAEASVLQSKSVM
jgi:hypothetical protein